MVTTNLLIEMKYTEGRASIDYKGLRPEAWGLGFRMIAIAIAIGIAIDDD